jgi:NAD(P)-dependent dehydrogenase (short-subunit alcohol dehydrogenase family)
LSQEQTVVVTGANGRIGRAVARQYAEEGATIVALDTKASTELAGEVSGLGAQCLTLPVDLTRRDAVAEAMDAALKEVGRIDVLVSQAFLGTREPFLKITKESWNQVLALTLKSGFLVAQATLPAMLREKEGSMVFVSSIAGRRSSSVMGAHYTCARHGLIGLTRHLAREFAGTGIRVNCVCPGPPDAPSLLDYTTEEERSEIISRTPLRRLADPDDVAEVIRFVAGPKARHMHGAIVDVNGGLY